MKLGIPKDFYHFGHRPVHFNNFTQMDSVSDDLVDIENPYE